MSFLDIIKELLPYAVNVSYWKDKFDELISVLLIGMIKMIVINKM